MKQYKTPLTICPHCQHALDAATDPDKVNEGPPRLGDLSICVYCGHVSIYDELLQLRKPTQQEAMDAELSPLVIAWRGLKKGDA